MGEKPSELEAPAEKPQVLTNSSSSDDVAHEWAMEKEMNGPQKEPQNKVKNPLSGMSKEELMKDVEEFAQEKNLTHILEELKKGALIAQEPKSFESYDELSESDKNLLRREKTHRWSQPFMMYFMTSMSPPPNT